MIYLVIINVLGFLIMGLDKAKAKKQNIVFLKILCFLWL